MSTIPLAFRVVRDGIDDNRGKSRDNQTRMRLNPVHVGLDPAGVEKTT
jgi:hypothetical protein